MQKVYCCYWNFVRTDLDGQVEGHGVCVKLDHTKSNFKYVYV